MLTATIRRGLRAVLAWLARQVHRLLIGPGAVCWTRLGMAAARHRWPAVRAAARALRLVLGLGFALVVGIVLWVRPVAAAAAASPRWCLLAAHAGERLRRRRVTIAGVVLVGLAWLLGPFSTLGMLVAVPAALWIAARVGMALYPHTTRGRLRTNYGIGTRGVPLARHHGPGGPDGTATFWELRRSVSAHAVREAAIAMRPSIAARIPADPDADAVAGAGAGSGAGSGVGASAAARALRLAAVETLPPAVCGTWLGRSAVGPSIGQGCWASHRDAVGLIAGPQTGKTALLTSQLIDHDGAALSTSTKLDVFINSAALRCMKSRSGRVELFNPSRLGGLASTFRWDPVAGCLHPTTARKRAGHMVGAVPRDGGDGDRWSEWASRVLASLLMAAERGGVSMMDVAQWCYSPNTGATIALQHLRAVSDKPIPPLVIDALSQVSSTEAKKTRDSIFLVLGSAVGFMTDPEVAEVCCPRPSDPVFDVAAFIADRGTLYVVGAEDGGLAPLLAALTGHVFETAKHVAATYPGERLDPPLMLALDEAALITPVPLHEWLADAGGRGIHIVWAVQSRSQLIDRWGVQGAATIENTTAALMFYGGTSDPTDLEHVARLSGHRHELVPDPDGPKQPGHARFERVEVITPDRVRTIPRWHAILVYRDMPVTIIRFRPVWERADVKAAGRPGAPTPPTTPDLYDDGRVTTPAGQDVGQHGDRHGGPDTDPIGIPATHGEVGPVERTAQRPTGPSVLAGHLITGGPTAPRTPGAPGSNDDVEAGR